ncbi:hypothetical protein OIO90_004549 [Microbotryomycetes sp. JL221]|nr:hypothetical protein OIO90_004549 [Microbotryomycetes sp. JL221]
MRSVAQPVAVITVPLLGRAHHSQLAQEKRDVPPDAYGDDHGATLSSLSSISLFPPLVSFSLRLPSRVASYLTSTNRANATNVDDIATPQEQIKRFRIHLLSSSQEDCARLFARQAPLPDVAQPSSSQVDTSPHFTPEAFQRLANVSSKPSTSVL